MANFDIAYNIMRSHEGYYQNDPNDPGGETYAGISRRYNPSWSGWHWVDLYKAVNGTPSSNMNLESVNGLYGLRTEHIAYAKDKFWNAIKGDQIQKQLFANFLFDTYWGKPNPETIKALQRLINVSADGFIGPITLNAINKHPNLGLILEQLRSYRLADYKKSPNWNLFGNAWTKRINSFKGFYKADKVPVLVNSESSIVRSITKSKAPIIFLGSAIGFTLLAFATKSFIAKKEIRDFKPETTT